jgi:co-chaperonin GroES (HSP10)
MIMAQSDKLKQEIAEDAKKKSIILPNLDSDSAEESGPIKIKKIECLNEFVAILVTTIESTIQLTENSKFKNEGIVVGVGPGLPDGSGGRTASQLNIGDVVLFKDNNVAMQLDPDNGFYKNKRIVIISERSLICKLPKREYELVEHNA